MATKYAIIKLAGKQFKVSEKDVFVVDRLSQEEGDEINVTDVLLVGDEKAQTVGTPLVDKASVTLKVVENGRSKKIMIGKFRAKSRYRRLKGHRQHQTTLEVVKING